MTHVYTPERTRQYLLWLLDSGLLASRYEQYADGLRDPGRGNSFYTRRLAAEGREAAEAELVEWNRKRRYSDFASLFEPTVRGILALSRQDRGAKGELVGLMDLDSSSPFARMGKERNRMVVVMNRRSPRCNCYQPAGAGIFGPDGQLGLKAVILLTGRAPDSHLLGFFMPIRDYERVPDLERLRLSSVFVTVDLTGFAQGHEVIPFEPVPDFLEKLLGVVDGPQPDYYGPWAGSLDNRVGFPGATNYLADHLPRLGEYFTALAEKLDATHRH